LEQEIERLHIARPAGDPHAGHSEHSLQIWLVQFDDGRVFVASQHLPRAQVVPDEGSAQENYADHHCTGSRTLQLPSPVFLLRIAAHGRPQTPIRTKAAIRLGTESPDRSAAFGIHLN
jgi:hypothetical protein